jgi:hypothetical protein
VSLTSNGFSACLKSNNGNSCSTSTNDQYTGLANTGGQPQVFCKISSGAPYNSTLTWIDANGKASVLVSHYAASGNIPFTIPVAPAGYYIVQVQDASGNVWPMTFKLS